MTVDAVDTPARPERRRFSRKRIVYLIVAALLAGLVGYLAHYGLCDFRSKFCVVEIAGTRSEVGAEWDSWSIYVSTYPSD